jgi:hypothetical protein
MLWISLCLAIVAILFIVLAVQHKARRRTALGAVVGAGLLVGASLTLAAVPGCSIFESSCTKALPAITEANTLIGDAQTKLSQAEVIIDLISDAEQKAAAQKALTEVKTGLAAASTAADAAITSCQALDVATTFTAFAAAWVKLEPFLTAIVTGASPGGVVSTPTLLVARPLALTRGQ